MSMHELVLKGCTPEPLISYLKALGILRLVSQQADNQARGAWRNDQFVLRSSLDEVGLAEFFLDRYEPTPILSPWNAGSGFYKKWNPIANAFKSREAAAALETIQNSAHPRLTKYREQIDATKAALVRLAKPVDPTAELVAIDVRAAAEGWNEKRRKKERDQFLNSVMLFEHDGKVLNLGKAEKDELLRVIRSSVVGDVPLQWLDAAFVITQGEQKNRREAPLLGSGGNVGNSDFSAMFAQMIAEVLPVGGDALLPEKSTALLRGSLFGIALPGIPKASVGQFFPGNAGGPNMTHNFEGDPILNPWDFILMLEGVFLLGGAASKRYGVFRGAASFPFAVDASAAGHDSASEDKVRGEIWLPIWTRFASFTELQHTFREGRSDVAGRTARDGITFAQAIATLGIERGIEAFTRFQFQARLGDNFLATSIGRFLVRAHAHADLLREVDWWLSSYRWRCGEKESNSRFSAALRRIDRAIFDYCRYGGDAFFQAILIALGAAERELANGETFRFDAKQDRVKVRPLSGLSERWITAAADHSVECEIALALAAVFDAFDKIGPLRANLEAFDWHKRTWSKATHSIVWHSEDLTTNLSGVLSRRVLDAFRLQCERLPLAFRVPASLDAIAQFLAREVDDERISALLWGFLPVEIPERGELRGEPRSAIPLPRAYALLKLCFLPFPIEINGVDHEIGPEPAILALLESGRVRAACEVALRRLRASGLRPLGDKRGHTAGSSMALALAEGLAFDGPRLAAALLIPISPGAVQALCRQVLRIPTEDEHSKNQPIAA
jgi:CRISPR-associated protein Csx17